MQNFDGTWYGGFGNRWIVMLYKNARLKLISVSDADQPSCDFCFPKLFGPKGKSPEHEIGESPTGLKFEISF